MEIVFASPRLNVLCNSEHELRRVLGDDSCRIAMARLASLSAASVLEDLRHLPGRCRELRARRAGQLALTLSKDKRLIFEPRDRPHPTTSEGDLDWARVAGIRILTIDDYRQRPRR